MEGLPSWTLVVHLCRTLGVISILLFSHAYIQLITKVYRFCNYQISSPFSKQFEVPAELTLFSEKCLPSSSRHEPQASKFLR